MARNCKIHIESVKQDSNPRKVICNRID